MLQIRGKNHSYQNYCDALSLWEFEKQSEIFHLFIWWYKWKIWMLFWYSEDNFVHICFLIVNYRSKNNNTCTKHTPAVHNFNSLQHGKCLVFKLALTISLSISVAVVVMEVPSELSISVTSYSCFLSRKSSILNYADFIRLSWIFNPNFSQFLYLVGILNV